MTRAPLIEEDKAFLQRLVSPRRHTIFAAKIIREIRGHPWKPGARPESDLKKILGAVNLALANYDMGTDEAQWFLAIYEHQEEALRYVRWCLAWEQRSKPEKDAYRRQ
jgi:hypothetical protein